MGELPTGTVTFLFTDIEGSTRLWEQYADAMERALARHNAIVAHAVGAHGGHVFKTGGDAFCCAFASATDAVAAALTAQQSLHAEAWDDDPELRVRMALHTGAAQEREEDYFGTSVNRVARLLACAHGGQTILSRATYELVREEAPEGVAFADLGEHSLRDLSRPEHVLQLCHPDLPSDFPPLRSLQGLAHNLPLQLTSFIGREREIEEVKRLLARTRLLTLTGVGGAGKTRLALQVAAEVLEDYADGVWLIELGPLADPELVAQTVASALGLREQPGRSIEETLTDHLRSRSCLLIVDNCEHVLDACARLSDELLRSCPELKVLGSSREGLGIAGETTYHVLSLSVPEVTDEVTSASVTRYESIRLFCDRAESHRPSFQITDANAGAVAQICRRLDGIPLAIELAAARVRAMPVEQIAERLDDRFRLLTGGSRAALPRQRTLQALIDWSYDLLDERERTLLRRLSVFAGGWTLEAAEAVCSGDPIEQWEVLDLLTGLVAKSVAVYEEQEAGPRYRLLETVRQYARDRLLQSAEGAATRGRHRDYFVALVTDPSARPQATSRADWLDYLEVEHDNLRTALDWCEQTGDGAEAGLRFASGLCEFWVARGHLGEGRRRLRAALSRATDRRTPARADALHGAGWLAVTQGDYPAARSLYREAVAIRQELGQRGALAFSLRGLGFAALHQGDYSTARAVLEQALAIRQEDGGMGPGELEGLALVARREGDYSAARRLQEQVLAIVREVGGRREVAYALSNLGVVALCQADYSAARAFLEESLGILRELGHKFGAALCLVRLGELAGAQKRLPEAARLFGAAEALREAIRTALPGADRDDYERSVAALRAAMGDEAFEAAWAEGRAMTMEEAVAYALGEGDDA